jgi:hypothetical protein
MCLRRAVAVTGIGAIFRAMKHVSVVCCLAAVLLAGAWAQAEPGSEIVGPAHAPQSRLSGGVVAGIGLADMSGAVDARVLGMASSPSPQILEGLSAGGFLTLQLDQRWGARVALRYSQRGASVVQAPRGMSGDEPAAIPYAFDLRLAYLEVPLVATFTIPYDGRLVPFFFAGADLGFLLSAEVAGDVPVIDADGNVQRNAQGNPETVRVSRDVKEGVSRFDVGVTLGAGMKFPLARGRLVLDARYSLGILAAADGGEIALVEGLVTLEPRGLRHRVLSLSAAYEL